MNPPIKAPSGKMRAGLLALALLFAVLALVILRFLTSDLPDGSVVLMDDLSDPRGLIETPDGRLCVAEAGYVAKDLPQAAPEVREDSSTGKVKCLDKEGGVKVLLDGVAHVRYLGSGVSSGAADLVEADGMLHLLVGESFGPYSRSLVSLEQSTGEIVADFFERAEAEASESIGEGSIRSNPYAVLFDRASGNFLVTDGATGEVLRVGARGQIDRYSPVRGHEVLTGIAQGPDGAIYVASFSQLPHVVGAGSIVRVTPSSASEIVVPDLTMPIDVALDDRGRFYVLEFASPLDSNVYAEDTGRLLRFTPRSDGGLGPEEVLVDRIPYPTSLVIRDSGSIAISVGGAFSAQGEGAVLEFEAMAESD